MRYRLLYFPVTPVAPAGSGWIIVRDRLVGAVLAAAVRVALLVHVGLFMLAVHVGPVAPVAPVAPVTPQVKIHKKRE